MSAPQPEESGRAFFAFHLKRLREQAKLSQPALGARVHVSGSLISGIETCTRTPGLGLCQALDRALAVPRFFEALYPRIIEETGLPAGFPEYADAEANANVIRQYTITSSRAFSRSKSTHERCCAQVSIQRNWSVWWPHGWSGRKCYAGRTHL